MFKAIVKFLFKLLLVAGAVFTAHVLMRYLDNRQTDYIKIYNDGDEADEAYL